jgi:putative CocE/NonD family hydrolase
MVGCADDRTRWWRRGAHALWVVCLATALSVAGCGLELAVPLSEYVAMDDGTDLAVEVWLPVGRTRIDGFPTVLRLGRYWRDYEFTIPLPPSVGRYGSAASWLTGQDYAVVIADVRGTGASFGMRPAPWSPREVADYSNLVDWVTQQPWSDGRIAAYGISYEGVAADWLGALRREPVQAVVPAYSYSDIYLDVALPGGIRNNRFLRAWGDVTRQMDLNDLAFIDTVAAADPLGEIAAYAGVIPLILEGVRPVAFRDDQLPKALAEHEGSTDVFAASDAIVFRDDLFGEVTADELSPLLGAETTRRSAAIHRVVGWLDAGTARGALRSYNSLDADHHVLVIAPHTHTGNYLADPYDVSGPWAFETTNLVPPEYSAGWFLYRFLKQAGAPARERRVVYYTYVENAWKETRDWPPGEFEPRRWYFHADGQLRREAPTAREGADEYAVDFEATTGEQNRWFSGLGGVPIRYLDRRAQDERLLVYESAPLEVPLELTGHPVVRLQVASTHADGAFIVYLEDVDPLGNVFYLTEGQLRALHRKVADAPSPTAEFGPYHTYASADAMPLQPGEVVELTFDLLPISTIVRRGHRLRVALAGHDADTFERIPASGQPVWRVERNAVHASWIDLPTKSRPDLDGLPAPGYGLPASTQFLCPTVGLLAPVVVTVGLIGQRRRATRW